MRMLLKSRAATATTTRAIVANLLLVSTTTTTTTTTAFHSFHIHQPPIALTRRTGNSSSSPSYCRRLSSTRAIITGCSAGGARRNLLTRRITTTAMTASDANDDEYAAGSAVSGGSGGGGSEEPRCCTTTSNAKATPRTSSSASLTSPYQQEEEQEPRAVHVYPFDGTTCPTKLVAESDNKYSNAKIVHFVRHAEGSHNVEKDYRNIANLDARLTSKGRSQCHSLAESIRNALHYEDTKDENKFHQQHHAYKNLLDEVELVVSSPLSRCLETAELAVYNPIQDHRNNRNADATTKKLEMVAHDNIRETVNYNCDRRRNIQDVGKEFDYVDFSHVDNDHDAIWETYEQRLGSHDYYTSHRESAEVYRVANRARSFFNEWLRHRPEQNVVICSHAAFNRCVWNFGHSPKINENGPIGTTILQTLDGRSLKGVEGNVPVVKYCCGEGIEDDDNNNTGVADPSLLNFEESMRRDYKNCELRSVIMAFCS